MGEGLSAPLGGVAGSRVLARATDIPDRPHWLHWWLDGERLQRCGAELFGYALSPPTKPSFFGLAGLDRRLANTIADLRDRAALGHAYAAARPDIVIHLAAQPLVSVGYANPG